MSHCLICGAELGTEPLNVDENLGVHTACLERLQTDDNAEWREAYDKIKELIDRNKARDET